MSKLWYQQPALAWEEALPLGNGRLGAMIFGGITNEQIQLNEESVWYGGPVDRNNPDTKEYLQEIRELIFSGKISEAEKLMKYAMSGTPMSQHPYQTLGDLHLEFEMNQEVTEYTRSLSLDTAVHNMSYTAEGVTYQREAFLSAPDNVLVMRLTADEGKKISFNAVLMRWRFYDYVKKVNSNGILLGGNLSKDGLDFAMMLQVSCKGGSVRVIGEHLLIEEADEAILYFTAGTTFRMTNLKEELENILEHAMSFPYEVLRQRHMEDYQRLYNRVCFELEQTAPHDNLPTDQRLQLASEGKVDVGLSKLYFDFGRYLLISSSREGTLPATLQGIWNKDMTPPWDSKYTININTEMNYWLAETCNLSECHMPLFDLIKRMLPNGQHTAQKMYGCRGFVAHHNTDIWGDTAVQDMWIPGSYWVMGAAWLCTHQWTHYEYTKGNEFLMEAFEVMREAAVFFLDFMIEKDGYLVTCPSVSPENTFILPSGEKGANSFATAMDNQIVRDLFTQCIKAAKVLGIDDELNQQIKEALNRLVPTRIGKHGQIMEWIEDYDEEEPGHRHISQLYGLHPSEQITMDGTPELAQAARKTLERRLAHGGGHTGWSRAWIMNHYAKLWDSEKAYYNLEMLLAKSTLPNMFDNHPPFQIDGNFGGAAAIAEMLVQSTSERIILLPALPMQWNNGRISGLCAKGGLQITMEWKDGSLTKCLITATNDVNTKVVYHKGCIPLIMRKSEVKDITDIILSAN
jgi:alpha-L-fucosidase 2